MAGYNETGTARKEYDPNSARAYCEGMNARIASALPVNPYSAPDLAEQIAWDAGVAYAATFAGGTVTDAQSCAIDIGATVPA